MKQKLDLKVEGLESSLLAGVKAGDVLLIRQQPVEKPAEDAAPPPPPPQLGCYTLDEPHNLVGVLPASARHLAPFGDVQARVRSVKRDLDGTVQQLLIRVEITDDGPATLAPSQPADQQGAPATKPEYVLHDDGFQLRRPQLEQLVHSQDLIRQLADDRLQHLLTAIDSSSNREQALTLALERPEFKQFSEQVLQLLDAGLPTQIK